MKTKLYTWYADCHGLISLHEYNSASIEMLELTSMYNPQRYITFGTINIHKRMYEYITQLIKNGDNKLAWILIGGSKEERCTEIGKLLSKDLLDEGILNLLMKGFEITCYNKNYEKILSRYTEMFNNDLFQELNI